MQKAAGRTPLAEMRHKGVPVPLPGGLVGPQKSHEAMGRQRNAQ